ncbi:MAG: hypothetical protein ABI222_02660 [Opitutaceae bacterium]
MSTTNEPLSLRIVGDAGLMLWEAASLAARHAARQGRRLWPKRVRGRCLAPGVGTPLWNELLARVQPHLRKRGTKAHLARLLGLPRQRLQDVLKARTACLDAERTLWLLCWISAREQGRDLGG